MGLKDVSLIHSQPTYVIWGLCSNFAGCEFFQESNLPDLFSWCETNFYDSADFSIFDFSNFFVRNYLLLIRKDTATYVYGFAVYVKEGLCFGRDLTLENLEFLFMFSTRFTY